MSAIELNMEKSTDIKTKLRSVSVDNLENVVKQLIEAALNNDEETVRLEMVVCGEEYYRKISKKKIENIESEHILKISNCKIEEFKKQNLENYDFLKINNSSEKVELTDKKLDQNSIFTNLIEESSNSKVPETLKNRIIENVNETKDINKSEELKKIFNGNAKLKLTKNPKTNKKEIIQEKIESNGDLSFEAWKAAKTKTYKQLLRKEKKKRYDDLLENEKKLEREKAAQMVYQNWKNDQQQKRKLKKMHEKAANQIVIASKIEFDKNRYANSEAFKEWKKRKDAKIRKEKILWRTYYGQSEYNQHSSTLPVQKVSTKHEKSIDFDSWLDQVDHVLHQKYLREWRFRVRSFYCQPTYYGTAVSIL